MNVARYGDAGAKASGRPKGTVMTIVFQLEGQEFMALNGGPAFTFSPAISLLVNCENQKELDELWEKLAEGGDKKRNNAAGCKTNTVCHGRSFPLS